MATAVSELNLIITTENWSEKLPAALQSWQDRPARIVLVDDGGKSCALPAGWQRVAASELLDPGEACRQFLKFLNDWPQTEICGHKSFDDLFVRQGGYSLWQTTLGAERNGRGRFFPKFLAVSLLDRALQEFQPGCVLLSTRHADLAAAWIDRCRRGKHAYELQGTREARPARGDRWAWLGKSTLGWLTYPWAMAARSMLVRVATGRLPARPSGSSVVFASRYFRYLNVRNGNLELPFWLGISDALRRRAPKVGQWFMIRNSGEFGNAKRVGRLFHGLWPQLKGVPGIAPIRERFLCLGSWLAAMPGQLRDAWRYFRLEGTSGFRSSFQFAAADVSSLILPHLRYAVAGNAKWAHELATTRRVLRWLGDVKTILVAEEFYKPALIDLAAARSLNIRSIGVQHGTIYPRHMVYTPHAGFVRRAPTPDLFACYGEQAAETVSGTGAYPRRRVRITGDSRFDGLVQRPMSKDIARTRLQIPDHARVVLITTQTFRWFPQAVVAVLNALRDRTDVVTLIKTHPKPKGMKADDYRRYLVDSGFPEQPVFEDRFEELLTACDVLVSGSSTTILEATLLGRRTLCVNFSDDEDWYPYVLDGASVGARTENEVRQALAYVLADENQAGLEARRVAFLERHTGPAAEGRCADALADLVLEEYSEGKRHVHLVDNDTPDQEERQTLVVSNLPAASRSATTD